MKDEELLEAVGAAAREEDAKALRELEEIASGGDEAARPLDDAARARIAARLAKATERKSGDAKRAKANDAKANDDPPTRVVFLRRAAWIVAPLAMAAAVLLWIGRGGGPIAALPEYELALVGGDQTTRATPAQLRGDTLRVRAGARVQISARPATKPDGEVAARAFLIEGGAARVWEVPIEISPEGAARISGDASAIFPSPSGDWDVVLALGRPGALPTTANVLPLLVTPTAAVKLVRAHVVVSGT